MHLLLRSRTPVGVAEWEGRDNKKLITNVVFNYSYMYVIMKMKYLRVTGVVADWGGERSKNKKSITNVMFNYSYVIMKMKYLRGTVEGV